MIVLYIPFFYSGIMSAFHAQAIIVWATNYITILVYPSIPSNLIATTLLTYHTHLANSFQYRGGFAYAWDDCP